MAADPKPYKAPLQLLATLISRGMAIADHGKAAICLRRIGYYRLSGYWFPMRNSIHISEHDGTSSVKVQDQFRPQSDFASVLDLYVFDKRLRLLMLDAIERIEIGIRVAIADHMGSKSPTAHLETAMLDGTFCTAVRKSGKTGHEEWLVKYFSQVSRSREEFIKHFEKKYPNLPLPIWVGSEVWDFGTLSFFFSGLKYSDKRDIAKKFGNIRPELLASWLRAINAVRNACAHHSRLWNAPLVEMPQSPRTVDDAVLHHLAGNRLSETRLYSVAAPLQFLLKTIHPTSAWSDRLKALCATFPQNPSFQFTQSGFPVGWQNMPLWT